MNKLVFSTIFMAFFPFLIGSNNFIIDKIGEKIGSFTDEALDGSSIDQLFDSDFFPEKIHDKAIDVDWFCPKTFDGEEGHFNESIDQFFREFNGQNSAATPIQIHFFGSKATPSSPFLATSPSSVRVPKFSLSDRPINFIMGGYAAAKDLGIALQNAQEGSTYRYLVGLETTSPLIASAVKQIQTWANQLNAMSIHSYDMTAAITPGLGPKIAKSDCYVCEQALIALGKELIEAKTLCQSKEKRKEVLAKLAEKNEQIFVGAFNVADKILSQIGVQTTKQLLMNMTGTVVSNGSGQIEQYPPLHKQIIVLLQEGQKIKDGYQMNFFNHKIEKGVVSIDFKPQNPLILDLFKSMQHKLRMDADFTKEENRLLRHSHFPMASFIALTTQYKGSGSMLVLERYSNLIAFERVVQFMEEAVQSILYKAESLRAAQISGYELELYIKQVREVLDDLRSLKADNFQKIMSEQRALDALIKIDQELREKVREA